MTNLNFSAFLRKFRFWFRSISGTGHTGLEGSLLTLSKYTHIICVKVLNGTSATWKTALFLFTFSDFGSISKSTNELSLSSSEGGNLSLGKTGVGLLEVLRSEGNVGVLLLLVVLE